MADLRIVAADNIKGSGLEMLKEAFGESAIEVRGKFSEEELCEKIGEMDALLIRSGTTVTRKAIEKANGKLKLIGRAGVGTDNIDKEAATEKGIIVENTPLGNTISAAEQAIALIFATARNVSRADREMQEGNWAKKSLVGVEVYGKTLGLIGMGKIGSHVAKVLGAAGMSVVAYDPFLSPERAKHMGVELVELEELFTCSDFISLHTPLTDKTRGMLNEENMRKMKKGVRIVNCARGGIIDEAALGKLVAEGHVAAAGIDVFATEPTTEGPLFGVKDLILTPHLGASTEEAEERCGVQMAEQVIAYFKDGAILNGVNISIAADKTLKPYVEVSKAMGKISGVLLNAAVESIEIICAGEIQKKDTSEVTASAVAGVLEAFGAEDVNIVNALHLAKQRGISVSETSGAQESNYLSHVTVVVKGGGKQTLIGGTAYNNVSPRITRIDDAEMDIKPSANMLFLRYPDKPGYVGKFGT
ncbi:MAG: phosphoglycerate dehydrogenase, partial [Planctomycetes bacterium]|nr:phosphoglycerate dehydrogenase [Planctomycetota bacterium]